MANSESGISPRKRKLLIVIWFLALAGFGVSIELTRIYYESFRNVDFTPFCAINQQVNCVSVALSKYSSILGVPISGFGMATYFLMLVVIPFRLRTRVRIFANLENYLALLAVWSMGMTIYLASVSTFILKTLCLWCTALYALNLAFFILIWLALDPFTRLVEQFKQDFELLRTDPRALGVLLGAVILAMVLFVVQLNRYYGKNSARVSVPDQGRTGVDLSVNKDPVLGPAQAPVTIIEFSDFQCPFCREMHFVLKEMRNKFGPRIRVVYKNFPLDAQCNPALKSSLHPNSCELAFAAECAYQEGCFEGFYDKLIESGAYGQGALMQMAIDCGMDPNRFQACMAGDSPKKAVAKDIDDAVKIGIKGTPMLVINGRIIQGSRSEKEMEEIIKAALEGKTSLKDQ